MKQFIAAIDQGTSSTRCMIFDHDGVVATAQKEHQQIYPQPGWVEHDPIEIWRATQEVIATAVAGLNDRGQIAAVGIANQRETTVVWDRVSGRPLYPAIVWQDTRTASICNRLAAEMGTENLRALTGLPAATYFSGPKLAWILDNIPGVRAAAERGSALFGTIDSWLIWNLSGGPKGGTHVIDVTNASRTLLMDLQSREWEPSLMAALKIPAKMLPRIVPSIDPRPWGFTRSAGPFGAEIPICGDLGDQQAALVGQACFQPGESKNTYGTGCFMLLNTGPKAIASPSGLLTTVAYQQAGHPAVYALEGSIAVAGALVRWLRDNLGLFQRSEEIETLAAMVADTGGVYIVPAFSGLFAPYWRSDARGLIAGLTASTGKGHLARAALESVAYQTRDVLEAMVKDSSVKLTHLKVDGGMTGNELLMQFQADMLGIPVTRSAVRETTALGAAYAAGLAVGFWKDWDELKSRWKADRTWQPSMAAEPRDRMYAGWQKAVGRAVGWIE